MNQQNHSEHTRTEENEFSIESMIPVIIHWICIHVSNTEDVDEHTEEGCYKEEHHCYVIDVNSDTEDLLLDGHAIRANPVSYTHLRAHETKANLVCRLLLEKKK